MLTPKTQHKRISGFSRYVWTDWTRSGRGQAGDRPVDRGSFRAGAESDDLLGKSNDINSKKQPRQNKHRSASSLGGREGSAANL